MENKSNRYWRRHYDWMKNKKNQWEYDYNLQIGVDDYSGIILSCGLNNHPTDFKELIPQIENIKENIGELPANTQISADNGYSTDRNMEYLEENQLDGYISSRKLSRKLKKYNRKDKPYSKDNFTYDFNKNAYICPEGQILDKIGKYKERKRTVYWTNNCKQCPVKEECCGKYRIRTITDYGNPSKIRMLHKMENEWAEEIYKKRSKTVEWPFGNIKRNMRIVEFNTTVQSRLSTKGQHDAVGTFLFDNALNKVRSYRKEVYMVGHALRGLYRSNIRIDKNRFDAFFL